MRAIAVSLLLVGCSSDPQATSDASSDDSSTAQDTTSTNNDSAYDAGMDAFDAKKPPIVDGGPSSTRLTAKPLGSTTAPNGFYEYLPPDYDGVSLYPLLVFFHGVGENGNGTTELSKILGTGLPKLIDKNNWPNSRPFIVLMSQHVGGGCPSKTEVDAFVNWGAANYPVDPKNVHLTALSCGAIGSWDYLGSYKGAKVASAVLICGNPGDPTNGGSSWGRAGCGLGEVAIWSFHGDMDPTVPFGPDDATMQKLLACPAPPRRDAKWTPIANGGHTIWDGVYDLSKGYGDIYAWMLQNPKP